ncbi:MAG: transposase [Sodalis sp. (in: enterobacteria)]
MFKWISTLLKNIKNFITSTYHVIRGQYAPHYMDKFHYRFNRHYDLEALMPFFLVTALKVLTIPSQAC